MRCLAVFVLSVTLLQSALARAEGKAHARPSDLEHDPRVGEADLRQQWIGLNEQASRLRARDVDRVALAAAEKWRSAEGAPPPVPGENGRVVFAYGATLVKIVCAPLRICDVELQAGEVVQDVHAGDSARWQIAPARSGGTTHLVIKPLTINISTNLAVYTDRRVYHLELESHAEEHMPFVSFSYPEDQRAAWRAFLQQNDSRSGHEEGPRAATTSTDYEIRANPGALRFGYTIVKEGRCNPFFLKRMFSRKRPCDWAPLRAYDDGEKTIIEMPRKMLAQEAPVLFVHENGEDKLVTFRLKGMHFVVDGLFTQAVLVKGVGRKQERVVIERQAED